jgi:hypothetical protein
MAAMGQAKPTTTTNPLHFEDMEPRRFEDLAQAIVHKLKAWTELNHIGRSGNDNGVDIEAVESDDGKRRRWVIQCKRYQSFAKSHAVAAIDEAVKYGKHIDVLLLVVGCDVSRVTREAADAHASQKGISDLRVWDASYIESTLYNDRPDLLFTYFGVDVRANQVPVRGAGGRRGAMSEVVATAGRPRVRPPTAARRPIPLPRRDAQR